MRCSECKGELKAIDTVHNSDGDETYRAKKCLKCGRITYTVEYEVIQNQRFAEDWADAHRYRRENTMKREEKRK